MFFDHPSGEDHPPVRTEEHLHAAYRKIFTLTKSMLHHEDVARPYMLTIAGLFGSDGAALCNIYDCGARFIAAHGSLSHMQNAILDTRIPSIMAFMNGHETRIFQRKELSNAVLSAAQYARFESIVASPIAINGMTYGFLALVSDKPNYFLPKDAQTLHELTRFVSMLVDHRNNELVRNERDHNERLGDVCRQVAPKLHKATIELIQTFAQLRKYYVEKKFNLMAEYLNEAVVNIEKMSVRTQDLRSLSDICKGRAQNRTPLELKPVIENVVEYNRTQIEERCTLEVLLETEVPNIYGDYAMIWQALHEIIRNALYAMEQKQRDAHALTIRLYGIAHFAVIEIADTGCGIEPADVPRIFEPLFSTWPAHHGLGLSRAQMNAMSLDGMLTYRPNPSGGAIFRMSFPDEQHAPQEEVF